MNATTSSRPNGEALAEPCEPGSSYSIHKSLLMNSSTGFRIKTEIAKSAISIFSGMTFFFLLLLSTPAFAAAPVLDPAFCQALVKHVPDADVNYQPGVDVHGDPVVPADLPDSPRLELPKTISIPLTADLFKILHFSTDKYPFNTMPQNDINLGTLTAEGNRVLFNGQPLTSDQQDDLAVLCMKLRENTATKPLNLKPQKP